MLLDIERPGINVSEDAMRRKTLLPSLSNEINDDQEEAFRDRKGLRFKVIELRKNRSI